MREDVAHPGRVAFHAQPVERGSDLEPVFGLRSVLPDMHPGLIAVEVSLPPGSDVLGISIADRLKETACYLNPLEAVYLQNNED